MISHNFIDTPSWMGDGHDMAQATKIRSMAQKRHGNQTQDTKWPREIIKVTALRHLLFSLLYGATDRFIS